VANKLDHPEAKDKLAKCRSRLEELSPDVFSLSSVTGEGLPELLRRIQEMLTSFKVASGEWKD